MYWVLLMLIFGTEEYDFYNAEYSTSDILITTTFLSN